MSGEEGVNYDAVLKLSKRFQLAARIAPDLADKFLIEQVAKPMVEEMKKDAPVRSGALRDTLGYVHHGPLKVSIGSRGSYYIKFVAEGTQPHLIEAVNAQALRWQSGGTTMFATSVNHPGTRANPFMTDARDKVLKGIGPRLAGIMMDDFQESNV